MKEIKVINCESCLFFRIITDKKRGSFSSCSFYKKSWFSSKFSPNNKHPDCRVESIIVNESESC